MKNQKLQILRQIKRLVEFPERHNANFSDNLFLCFNQEVEKILNNTFHSKTLLVDFTNSDFRYQLEFSKTYFNSEGKKKLYLFCYQDDYIISNKELLDRFIKFVFKLFKQINSLNKDIYLYLIYNNDSKLSGFIEGLCFTLIQENYRLFFMSFFIDQYVPNIIEKIVNNNWNNYHQTLYIQDNDLFEQHYQYCEKNDAIFDEKIFRDKVIIITGQGKIALSFSEYLIRKYNAKIIILGRRELENSEFEKVKYSGIKTYIKTDLGKITDLEKTWLICEEKFGKIDGIFHLAGILQDSLFRNKDFNSFYQVVYPKLHCTINLSNITLKKNLDFFVNFSSLSGAIGNLGQSDYSAANGFLRHFTQSMNSYLLSKNQIPYFYCIDWGLWEEGGMKITQEQDRLIPLTSPEAFGALEYILQFKILYSVIYKGDTALISDKSKVNTNIDSNQAAVDCTNIRDLDNFVSCWIKEVIIKYTKFTDLEFEESIIEKGADSVATINIVSDIEKKLKQVNNNITLNKTIIFERYSLKLILSYLIENYLPELQKLFEPEKAQVRAKIERDILNQNQQNITKTINLIEETDVCIVGMSGQFPKAKNIDEFWDNLSRGKNCIQVIPKARWDWKNFYDPQKNVDGKSYGRHGGFLNSIKAFDPLFFNISPSEAEILDPQERMVLQNTYHAIQDSCTLPQEMQNTGVFTAVMFGHYKKYDGEQFTDSSFASIANRVSYFFDFQGPSISIDTMCSGGLTGVHLAVRAIKNNDCESAIVSGVNLMPHPIKYKILSRGNFLSLTGKCNAFGVDADGYVPGEGVITLVLKKVANAIKDKNYIYGIIKGTAINACGRSAGYTVPSQSAQEKVIQKALSESGLSSNDVNYIEAHGTGTKLGDPIEINALRSIYNFKNNNSYKCPIGSVKTNIGHLESAAGLAGVVKVLCQIKEKKIAPTLNCEEENPLLNLSESKFFLPKYLQDWNTHNNKPRIAGISSFGAGGSNAHLIIQEFENHETSNCNKNYKGLIFAISAKSSESLKKNTISFAEWLKDNSQLDLYSLSYTLCCTREHFKYRIGLIFNDIHHLRNQLQQIIENNNWDIYKIPNLQQDLPENEIPNLLFDIDNNSEIANKLLDLYKNGITINWYKIFTNKSPIKLPLYNFDEKEYWIKDFNKSFEDDVILNKSTVNYDNNEIEGMLDNMHLYEPAWEKQNFLKNRLLQNIAIILVNNNSLDHSILENIKVELFDTETLYRQINYLNNKNSYTYAKIVFDLTKINAHDIARLIQYFFDFTKYILTLNDKFDLIFLVNHNSTIELSYIHSLISFYKTIILESEYVRCKFIKLQSNKYIEFHKFLIQELNTFDFRLSEILYNNEERFIKTYSRILNQTHNSFPSFADGKTYIITGGMGKVCQVIAQFILRRYSANLILIGSSELDQKKSEIILRLSQNLGSIEYKKVDVKSKQEVSNCIEYVISKYGQINGIIHAAGKTDDKIFLAKNNVDFQDVIDIKVEGAIALDAATKNLTSLDFFVLFSSIASIFGNVGQADYAMGNGFLDAFAEARNVMIKEGSRSGKTLSINWPLWESGGMQISQDKINYIISEYGFYPLTNSEGISFFNHIISNIDSYTNSNIITLKGQANTIDSTFSKLFQIKNIDSRNLNLDNNLINIDLDEHSIKKILIEFVSEIIKVDKTNIDIENSFGDYGFDSVSLIKLGNKISQTFTIDIPPNTFFTQNTIQKILTYITQKIPKTPSIAIELPKGNNPSSTKQISNKEFKDHFSIIGLDGIMPNAYSLNDFWQNMYLQQNAIQKIIRWSNRDYFGGIIHGLDHFDNNFFGLSARESMLMDPQHRLFLQVAYNAIINAGYNPGLLRNVGVFVGVQFNDYQVLLQQWKQSRHPYAATGNAHAMLANRVSYLFNFNGPSQTIDTACSSAIVAIKRAILALENNECDFALVGAVSLLIDHEVTDAAKSMGVLSLHSQCATFDEGADGYVRGEGVGCIVLKRKSDAEKDKDNIYANIISCSENHGGKSHSLTAPNPEAQKALLLKAYKDVELARRISYIEAHGTGTKLGDPIEIDALKMAWKEMGVWNNKAYIGLGSVKTHIGHLEPAAGIASILKVLLAMQHRILPGNLHFNKLNPYIDIKDSPFYIVSKNQEWRSDGPLVSGISSFGFGGSNTHIVLEEAERRQRDNNIQDKFFYLCCISAKNLISLDKLRKNLIEFLSNIKSHQNENEYSISNISYTLNIGREHFSFRNSWIVRNIEELIDCISKESYETEELVLDSGGNKEVIEYSTDADIYYNNLRRIRTAYLSGRKIDWDKLHENDTRFRVALPTYPFNTKPFWFENAPDSQLIKNINSFINSSYEINIKDKFSIEVYIDLSHPWFKEHIVNDEPILPGVAHLSLAFQGAKVLNIIHDFNGFQNINWILPVKYGNIIVDYKVSNENIYFEIKTNKGEKCSQGEILFNDRSTDEFLNHLDDFSNNISTISYSGETLYSIFDRIGIRYGNFFKNLQKIYVINDQKCYGLLEVQNSIEELKTNLLDAAFQSTLGLSINNLQEPLLPFSAAKIFVSEKYINTLSGKFYVMVEKKSFLRSDISIFNSDKQMIVTVKDLGVLPTININKKHNMVNFNETNNNELYCHSTTFIPQWFESNDNNQKSNSSKFFVILYTIGSENSAKLLFDNLNTKYVCHLLELIDENSANEVKNIIGNNLQNTEIIVVDSTKYGINEIKSIYDKSYFFIEFLKKISRLFNVKIKVLTSQVVQYDEYNPNLQPQNSLIIGIAQTAAKEFTNLRIIPISVSQLNSQNSELLEVESNYQNPSYQPILYHKGKRYIRKLVPYKFEKLKESKFKYNGLYMIFGGLGGIGFELSKYLAQNYKANLVLVGRSDLDIAKIEEINRFGGTVSYEKVDLLNKNMITNLLHKYAVNGIIHSALTLLDKTIQFMNRDTLNDVLDPKVIGSINLYNAIVENNLDLDFVLFFSSIQSFIANSGQANYTAACVFKDTIANLLRNFNMQNTKIINWGYWGSVGIVSTDEYRNRMSSLGIGSIEPEEGFKVIEQILTSDINQITVIKGTEQAFKNLYIDFESQNTKAIVRDYFTNNISDLSDTKNILSENNNILDELIPIFKVNDITIQNHQLALKKLEEYARYSIQSICIPTESVLSRYDRLIKAINAMPKTDQIDKSEILHDYPWLVGHINLLDKCISKYAEILTGKIDYMSVLFPDGKFDLVEPIYRDNPISDYYNIKVSEIVENYINSRLTHHPIRIIEIGAGTGSTTKFVLPKLREKDSYYYTDLSIAFLKKAKNEFSGFQNVKYDICNIEEDSKEDLIGSFDILIATNVLHATKNIKRTIANVRKYVKTDGIAIINEVTERSDFATLTFGLTLGWWLYSDSRIIDSPLIDSNIWKEILLKNNFIEVKFYGNQGQKVIVALAGKTNLDNNFTCDNTIQESVSKISYDVNSSNRDYNKDIANSVEKFITKNISQIMKIPYESLNVTTAFANYGIDSLIVLELAKPFKEIYKELPTTIFFEYSTISNLKNYLLKEYKEESEKAFKTSEEIVIQSSKDIKPTMIDDNRFKTWLKDTICHVIRIDPKELNENTPFANYGIDSLITLEIVKLIANKLGYLPNTIFFEYTTLNSLYTYLIGQYSEKIKENFVVTESTSSKPPQNLEPSSLSQRNENDVAVIGLSGKFPKAKNIDEFWNNLVNGLNCTTAIPLERWNNSEFYDPEGGLGKIYTNYGCFIEDVEYFDNKFFQITPFDAENIDPQERLFLQTTYHAIENSGYKVSDLKGSNIGVFVGIMNAGYSWLGIDTDKMNWADTLYWSVANRVSYNFDWHGPSMAVDTACSSSLTAIHLACQSIQNGESTMAIAGGVNLILHPKQYSKLCRLRMLSKGLECRSFGENADGFVDGEGIAAIFLKPLNQAIKDKDRIFGVIKGSSINAGGHSNGYTAPNPLAQSALISSTITKSQISSDTIDYVEAHGTGTELGDPIEIRALNLAFNTNVKNKCAIGSVKSNIGHLESAAGVAGIIKVLYQMYNEKIVPTLNSKTPNSYINFDDSPFYLSQEQIAWNKSDIKNRIAMISSFGAGGANANAIIEEFKINEISDKIPYKLFIILISGHSIGALQRNIDALRIWLKGKNEIDLYSITYTLSVCREHYKYRRFFIVENKEQLINKLSENLFNFTIPEYYEMEQQQDFQLESIELQLLNFNDLLKLYKRLGKLYLDCHEFDWSKIYSVRKISDLPPYEFDDYIHWIDQPKYGLADKDKYYHHHIVNNKKLLPAAYTLSLAQKTTQAQELSNICWLKPLVNNIEHYEFINTKNNFVISDTNKNEYCSGSVGLSNIEQYNLKLHKISTELQDISIIEKDEIYKKLAENGYAYGDKYRKLQWIKYNNDYALGAIYCNPSEIFNIDPSIIDSGLQIPIFPLAKSINPEKNKIIVPFHLSGFILHSNKFDNLTFCFWELDKSNTNTSIVKYNMHFFNQDQKPLITLYEMTSKIIETNNEEHYSTISVNIKDGSDDDIKIYDFS